MTTEKKHNDPPPKPVAAQQPRKKRTPQPDVYDWARFSRVVVEDLETGRRHVLTLSVVDVDAAHVRTEHGELWRRRDGIMRGTKGKPGTTRIRPELPHEATARQSTEVAVTISQASPAELWRGLRAWVRGRVGADNGRV